MTLLRTHLVPLTTALLLAGCPAAPSDLGTDPIDPVDPVDPIPPEVVQMTACAQGEGALVRGWSVDNGHGAVSALAAGQQGTVALAGEDGSIKLWHLDSGDLDWTSEAGEEDPGGAYGSEFGDGGPLQALSFDPTGELVTSGDGAGMVTVFSSSEGVDLAGWTIGEAPVTAVAHGFDGELLAAATAAYGGDLRVWSLGGSPGEDALSTSMWFINALEIDNDREEVIAAGDIYGVPSVEVRSAAFPGAVLGVVEVWDIGGTFTSVASLGDGRVLAGGLGGLAVVEPGADDAVHAVNLADGRGFISVVALDSEHFVAATTDGAVVVGTIDDLTIRTELETPETSVLVAVPGGLQFATAGDDGMLRLFSCEG